MAKQNRSTLKRYFKTGCLPSEEHFGDLIESSLNPIDEGFDKSPENGFEISLIGKHKRLISFFKAGIPENAVWTIEYDDQNDRLLIRKPVERPAGDEITDQEGSEQTDERSDSPVAMTFSGESHVGINNTNPVHTLDVGGVVAAEGRLGANPDNQKTILANGVWQNIKGPLRGCHAIEVMAGVGHEKKGKYALLKALAMNTFNPDGIIPWKWMPNFLRWKKRIKTDHAYYLSRGDRIQLQWTTEEDGCFLQMRTCCGYGDGIKIRYYLTTLWVDSLMSESEKTDEDESSAEC